MPRSFRPKVLKETYDLYDAKTFHLPLNPYDGQTVVLNVMSLSPERDLVVSCHMDQSIETRTCDLTMDVKGSYAFIYVEEGRFWAVEPIQPEHQWIENKA